MTPARRPAGVLALLCAAVLAGCGLGAGSKSGSAELRVTRDYGSAVVTAATEDGIPESETVMRLLDGKADVATRYGGGFVHSIDGIEGTASGARRSDWFFYVNGVESPVGAADVPVRNGDRIWWDYRDWTAAMRVPAVVGSWPEPFAHGFEGSFHRTRIDCLAQRDPCEATAAALAKAGVKAGIFESQRAPGFDAESEPTLRVLVGPWARVRTDPGAAQIEDGPAHSGVFARFEAAGGGFRLLGLDVGAGPALRLGPSTGLIAAVREGQAPPTWVVTGTDPAGVGAAAEALTETNLQDRYAVVVQPGKGALPVPTVMETTGR